MPSAERSPANTLILAVWPPDCETALSAVLSAQSSLFQQLLTQHRALLPCVREGRMEGASEITPPSRTGPWRPWWDYTVHTFAQFEFHTCVQALLNFQKLNGKSKKSPKRCPGREESLIAVGRQADRGWGTLKPPGCGTNAEGVGKRGGEPRGT